MTAARLEARVEEREGRPAALCPAVGVFHAEVEEGAVVGTGARIGRLEVLGVARPLHLGETPPGRVAWAGTPHRPVEYGEALLLLEPLPGGGRRAPRASRAPLRPARGRAPPPAPAGEAPGDEERLVRAFSGGLFYLRPSPEAAPYVSVGEEVERGRVLGLIEVMKSFHRVLCEAEGVVAEIMAQDGGEVVAGQPLFRLRPKG